MFGICENKDADQLRGDPEADQHLCFRYIGSAIPLLSKSEISSLYPSSVAVQPGLSDQVRNQNVGFLMTRLIYFQSMLYQKLGWQIGPQLVAQSLSHEDVDRQVQLFPPCMGHLHRSLRQHHRLNHHARVRQRGHL